MKIAVVSSLALLLCLAGGPPAAAAVVLEGTRIIHDAGKGRDVTLKSVNAGERPALTQAWIDIGDSHARPEDVRTPFRMTPSAPRLLQPQEGQAWRITFAPRPSDAPLPQDRESLFYFNLLDIPPKPADTGSGNLLQFAVRTRIKLFHRPQGLAGKAQDAAAALIWQPQGQTLRVDNPTAYHVSLSGLQLPDGTHLDMDMIAPGTHLIVPLSSGTAMPASIVFTWLDDYGAARETTVILKAPAGPAAS